MSNISHNQMKVMTLNTSEAHHSLAGEYFELKKIIQKNQVYALVFLVGIWISFLILKKLQIEQADLLAINLFGLFVFYRGKTFNLRRNLDKKMTRIALEGLELEQRSHNLEKIFLRVLQQFGAIRMFILRSFFDLIGVAFVLVAAWQAAENNDLTVPLHIKKYFYLVMGILGILANKLYSKPFQPLLKAKQALTAKQGSAEI